MPFFYSEETGTSWEHPLLPNYIARIEELRRRAPPPGHHTRETRPSPPSEPAPSCYTDQFSPHPSSYSQPPAPQQQQPTPYASPQHALLQAQQQTPEYSPQQYVQPHPMAPQYSVAYASPQPQPVQYAVPQFQPTATYGSPHFAVQPTVQYVPVPMAVPQQLAPMTMAMPIQPQPQPMHPQPLHPQPMPVSFPPHYHPTPEPSIAPATPQQQQQQQPQYHRHHHQAMPSSYAPSHAPSSHATSSHVHQSSLAQSSLADLYSASEVGRYSQHHSHQHQVIVHDPHLHGALSERAHSVAASAYEPFDPSPYREPPPPHTPQQSAHHRLRERHAHDEVAAR